jgi:hypothetical protein
MIEDSRGKSAKAVLAARRRMAHDYSWITQ